MVLRRLDLGLFRYSNEEIARGRWLNLGGEKPLESMLWWPRDAPWRKSSGCDGEDGDSTMVGGGCISVKSTVDLVGLLLRNAHCSFRPCTLVTGLEVARLR